MARLIYMLKQFGLRIEGGLAHVAFEQHLALLLILLLLLSSAFVFLAHLGFLLLFVFFDCLLGLLLALFGVFQLFVLLVYLGVWLRVVVNLGECLAAELLSCLLNLPLLLLLLLFLFLG